jgi:transposase
MPRPRRFFPPEYKAEVVELIRTTGKTVGQVARELDLTETAVREWVKRADLDAGRRTDGLTIAERDELRRLRRENRDLGEEREILRKAAVSSPGETGHRELLPADRRGEAHHQVSRRCRVLGVARAGSDAWAAGPPSRRTLDDAYSRRTDPPDPCPQPGHLWRHACTPSYGWAWTSTSAASASPG